MDILTLPNLAAWSIQVFVVVLLAAGLMAAARIDAAGVRYAFWRGVLALCLVLPLVQGRQPAAGAGSVTIEMAVTAVEVPASPAARGPADWTPVVLFVIAAGAAVRLGWLGLNGLRLRRLRRRSEVMDGGDVHADLQALIGVRCDVRYVPRLRQPVTFGVLRPVILLPAPLREAAPDVQRAVISHELFHVKRRDWAWLVAEELVCAALWFNPAIWWTVARVHDARELVVDELAVLATGRRRAYVEALMAFADETSLAPVAAFGGRSSLFHRIVQLSQERVMSSHRLVFTCGVVAAVLSAGAWQAVAAFPLAATVQQPQDGEPQAVERSGASATRGQVNADGALRVGGTVKTPKKIRDVRPVYPDDARAAGVSGVVILEARIGADGEVEEAAVLRSIPMLDEAALDAVRQWAFTPTLLNGEPVPVILTVTVNFTLQDDAATHTIQTAGALRVGGAVKPPKKIRDVRPAYPAEARDARVSGVVILEVRIGPGGEVEDAVVLRSVPMLDEAALDAVRQWAFTPTLLNGQPVPVIMTVTVNFTLQKDAAPRAAAVAAASTAVEPAAR